MDRLGVLGQVVPEHVGVLEVGLRVALLCEVGRRRSGSVSRHTLERHAKGRGQRTGVDEDRELDGVAEKEDGSGVPDHVPVALGRLDLDGEAPRVARGVTRAALAADGRETDDDLGLRALPGNLRCARAGEEGRRRVSRPREHADEGATRRRAGSTHVGAAEVRPVVRRLPDAERARALGVDDPFGDALAIKRAERVAVGLKRGGKGCERRPGISPAGRGWPKGARARTHISWKSWRSSGPSVPACWKW